MSGQIFMIQNTNSAGVRANGVSYSNSVLLRDSDGFVSSIQTSIPATEGRVSIQMNNVINLGRAVPLSAQFDIFLSDG